MSVHGKKTRNPGWQANNHWVVCDRCGFAIRAKDSKTTWDGLVVCPDDWEVRHPQDFVRSVKDNSQPVGPTRPETDEVFTFNQCGTRTSIAGQAEAGCAITGFVGNPLAQEIPSGTFS